MVKVISGIVVIVAVFIFMAGTIGILNTEARLRVSVEAQQEKNTAVFDRVWKTISQTAQITDQYKNDFAKIYGDIMTKSDGNAEGEQNRLLVFIQSVNPQFDTAMYTSLAAVIESNRLDFEREQKMLIDIDREHDEMFAVFPSSVILNVFGRTVTDITVVTSEKTQKTFLTGEENDISLFPQITP